MENYGRGGAGKISGEKVKANAGCLIRGNYGRVSKGKRGVEK